MEAVRLHPDSEVAEASSEPASQRQARNNDGDLETGEPQHKHRMMTAIATPSGSSTVNEGVPSVVGTEAAREDVSYTSLVALSVYSRVDLSN